MIPSITEYKIDAYGTKQYNRIQKDQKTELKEIPNIDIESATLLNSNGISMVSNLLDSEMKFLLSIEGMNEEKLDLVYESVQNYIEREIEEELASDVENEII